MPFLTQIRFDWDSAVRPGEFPFNIRALRATRALSFKSNITFFAGENGSGKSTLLEAIACHCGFGPLGGTRDEILFHTPDIARELLTVMKFAWQPRVGHGCFFRAESFHALARHIDEHYLNPERFGHAQLLAQSHGESFLRLFARSFQKRGIYLLDEPEAALSPQNQLAFLTMLHESDRGGESQFVIATHSPILLACPHAIIYNFDDAPIRPVAWRETDHYRITRDFLNQPEVWLNRLLTPSERQPDLFQESPNSGAG